MRFLLEYVVTFRPTLPITLYVPDAPVFRSIENPLSSVELSVQARSIWLDETTVAARLVGGFMGSVVPLASLVYAEYVEPEMARTR